MVYCYTLGIAVVAVHNNRCGQSHYTGAAQIDVFVRREQVYTLTMNSHAGGQRDETPATKVGLVSDAAHSAQRYAFALQALTH